MMSERYHIYGATGLIAIYFIVAMAIFIVAGTFGEEQAAGIDFFTIILFGTLPAIALFRTVQFGNPGKNKASALAVGFIAMTAVTLIFRFVIGLSVYYEFTLTAVMAAFAEEFFARGFVYPIMMRWSGNFFIAGMASSLSWSIMHIAAYGWNIPILAYIFISGMVLCYTMEYSQSLDVPVTIHLLNNLVICFGFFGGI